MLGRTLVIAALSAAPPTTEPSPTQITDDAPGRTLSDVVREVWDNLGNNGYQTGVAFAVATVALVVMLNAKVKPYVVIPVSIGAFWAGWLGWNTFTGQDNPLFPGEVSATKLWDVAFNSDTGFLIAVIVVCVSWVLFWRKGVAMTSRIWLIVGALLGASFVYSLIESVRDS